MPTTDSSAKSLRDFWRDHGLWLSAALVVLLTLAAHARGLHGQFVEWDDTTHIMQNAAIRALTLDNLRAMFTEPIAKLYCPLTWLSFALDYRVWGRDPFGYHFTNLMLHLGNTVLVLILVHRLFASLSVTILTAAIFGVHPLRVESVAWATERKDVLFAFFYLLALLAYVTWVTKSKRSAFWCCFGCFIAAVLSKSTAVTFPIAALLLDFFWKRRVALIEKIPFIIVSAIITVATVAAQSGGTGETVASTEVIPVWARAGLVGYCALFYVGKFFWPFHLSAIYPTFEEMNWTPATAAGYLLGFIALTIVVIALRKRVPILLPAWLFYLATLSPTIGLVPVGVHVVADYYSYLPLLGLAVPVCVGISALLRYAFERSRVVGFVLSGCVAVWLQLLSVSTFVRAGVWANTETLLQNVLQEHPQSYPALVNLTIYYTGQKRLDEAIATGRRAVEVAPSGLVGRKNLAMALIAARQYREAIATLRPAVEHDIDDAAVWHALYDSFTALGDQKNAAAAKSRWLRLSGAGN